MSQLDIVTRQRELVADLLQRQALRKHVRSAGMA